MTTLRFGDSSLWEIPAQEMHMNNPELTSDDPTIHHLLDRRRFAEQVSSLILNAPTGPSFRIGIFGEWGEGKSSVMRMMEAILRSNEVRTALFVPWVESDREALSNGLIQSVLDALDLSDSRALSIQVLIDLIRMEAQGTSIADHIQYLYDQVLAK